jgi:signal transduction histidine kinase
MEENEANRYRKTHPLFTQSQHLEERHGPFFFLLLRLRSPLVGYCVAPLFTAIGWFILLIFRHFGFGPHSATTGFYLSTVVIACLWGTGPAFLATLLGYAVLESFIILPYGLFTFHWWRDTGFYLPFLLVQLLVVMLTAQREKARRTAQMQAQEQALMNQMLMRTNQQLERANQLKDVFLSEASHELKNPVAAILGRTHLILRHLTRSRQTVPELPTLQTSLERIEAQTYQLQALISDYFDVSSLHSGKAPLRLASCDLGDLCRAVVEEQRLLSDRPIDLELPVTPAELQADSQRLTELIVNLVNNALKYSPGDAAVRVTIQDSPGYALLVVHNDGSAIPLERQEAIFELFYRAPEAESSSIKGSGLGLSICKAIVERHDGEIWVESAEGKGTTFLVKLKKDLQARTNP